MAKVADAGVAMATGSVTTTAPGGTTIDGEPPNVRSCNDDVSTVLTPVLVAMVAALIWRGSLPHSLVKRTLTALPAIEVCTISRTVVSARVGIVCHESPPKGAAAHVPTQDTGVGWAAVDCAKTVETGASNMRARHERIIATLR